MSKSIVILGADNSLGKELLTTLAEQHFPAEQVTALVAEEQRGRILSYGLQAEIKAQVITDYELPTGAILVLTPGITNPADHIAKAQQRGCWVIDDTTYAASNLSQVPAIIPNLNFNSLQLQQPQVITNPNAISIQLLKVLAPLTAQTKVTRAVISTYQSVSSAGKEAMDELYGSTKKIFEGDRAETTYFSKPIAFNVLPQTDTLLPDGNSAEEIDIVREIKEITHDQTQATVTCVYVPTFVGTSLAVNLTLEQSLSPEMIQELLGETEHLLVMDRPTENLYATPLDCKCDDNIYISRIRQDPSNAQGINLWITADNMRLEAGNIADILTALLKP